MHSKHSGILCNLCLSRLFKAFSWKSLCDTLFCKGPTYCWNYWSFSRAWCWKMESIHWKKKKWHEISNGFPVTDDSGWWWKSLFHTVECVKHLDKKLQGGHLKPVQTNWKRVWRHVSVSIYQIFASRLLPVTSHSDWIRSNLAVGESETLKQKHWVSVAVHVSLTTVPWSHLATILVLHLHIIKGMLFNWRNIKHALIRSRGFFHEKWMSFFLPSPNKQEKKQNYITVPHSAI